MSTHLQNLERRAGERDLRRQANLKAGRISRVVYDNLRRDDERRIRMAIESEVRNAH